MKYMIVILVVAFIIAMPFAIIWALNTLFPALNIAYTFQTWLAVVLISSIFQKYESKASK
jgi:hypothetical protein